jgi:hypothetical protein
MKEEDVRTKESRLGSLMFVLRTATLYFNHDWALECLF